MAVRYLKANKKYKKSWFSFFKKFFKKSDQSILHRMAKHYDLPDNDLEKGLTLKKTGKAGLNVLMLLVKIFTTVLIIAGLIFILAYFNIPFGFLKKNNIVVISNAGLVVNTEFNSAEVFLGDQKLGSTPVNLKSLGAGTYTLKLVPSNNEKHFLSNLEVPITLVGGRTTVVKAQVGPTHRTSSYSVVYSDKKEAVDLIVKTEHPGVEVYVDDKKIGVTPVIYEKLDAGPHVIKLKSNGYRTISIEVNKNINETLYIKAKLYEYILNAH